MAGPRSILRALGSLSFAAAILMLLIVALACATVHEATHGTPQALATFYKAWWFQALLGLLGLNALASMAARFPFNRRQVGFVLTHGSLLAILVGAWVTEQWGIDGQLAIAEGQTARTFNVSQDTLALHRRGSEQTEAAIDLKDRAFGGFAVVEEPTDQKLTLGPVTISVQRYLPDSRQTQRVLNDSPRDQPAVEVAISSGGRTSSVWVFAETPTTIASLPVAFRAVADPDEFQRLTTSAPASQPESAGTVRIEIEGASYDLPVEECLQEPVSIDDTGYAVRVLQYLPHARVDEGPRLVSASDRPVNPAIQLDLTGPAGTVQRWAFARFPDFGSMHGQARDENVKITFLATHIEDEAIPIEIIAGPDGKLYARFNDDGNPSPLWPAEVGTPIPTPWAGAQLTLLQRFDRARVEQVVEPISPPRDDRTPAVLLTVNTPAGTSSIWLQKYQSRPIIAGETTYDIVYRDKSLPLGFDLKLTDFRIGTWPGTQRPRSFESSVTLFDPQAGREQARVISMNSPATHGGYTLFQSSYRQGQQGRPDTSILSVSWDPGQPIVFAGYIGLVVGMLWVLVVRMRRTTSQ